MLLFPESARVPACNSGVSPETCSAGRRTPHGTRMLPEANVPTHPGRSLSQAVDSNSVNAETQFFELALAAESCATLS